MGHKHSLALFDICLVTPSPCTRCGKGGFTLGSKREETPQLSNHILVCLRGPLLILETLLINRGHPKKFSKDNNIKT